MADIYASNVITYKYDTALDFHVTMYDNIPYQRDSDYCNVEKLALVSGKVIKFYFCNNQLEAVTINNRDDEIEEILEKVRIAEKKRRAQAIANKAAEEKTDEVTQEQIQTILDDKEESGKKQNNSIGFGNGEAITDASPDAVNAFADVEDW